MKIDWILWAVAFLFVLTSAFELHRYFGMRETIEAQEKTIEMVKQNRELPKTLIGNHK